MTNAVAFAGPFAFVITFAETWIASRERYWERQAKKKTKRESIYSANWSLAFEIVLLVDIVLTVAEPLAIGPWVAVGAWLGQYWSVEKQRRKWRANVGRIENIRRKRNRGAIASESLAPTEGVVEQQS